MSAAKSAELDARGVQPTFISVVLPVLNGEKHLGQQLDALSSQTYAGAWELVIVDNGCTDGTLSVVERWRSRLPSMRIVDARARRGLNYARNVGARAARGDYLAFCDADDVVTPGWLDGLADAAPSADIVAGVAELETLNGSKVIPSRTGEPPGGLRLQLDFLRSVPGGNCGMWTSVARAVLWDESFAYGSSDIEFSWRASLASYRLGVAPQALLRMRQRTGLFALARQWYLFGKSDAQLFRCFGHAGMPRSSASTAFSEIAWLVAHLPDLARSAVPRRKWVTLAARRAGRAAGSITYRVFFP